mmetsp:Transcript_10089/g.20394  ORF Transcript_10089/g.20394 Transcript_10089/m.20394 type:complete len:110 (-) Transcript_10089:2-331(-)
MSRRSAGSLSTSSMVMDSSSRKSKRLFVSSRQVLTRVEGPRLDRESNRFLFIKPSLRPPPEFDVLILEPNHLTKFFLANPTSTFVYPLNIFLSMVNFLRNSTLQRLDFF